MITRTYSSLIETLLPSKVGLMFQTLTCAICLTLLTTISNLPHSCDAYWIPNKSNRRPISSKSFSRNIDTTAMYAKRNRNNKPTNDKLNSWYDSVDDDATPDEVFWKEMERQRMINQIPGPDNQDPYIAAAISASSQGGNMLGASSVDALNTGVSRKTTNGGANSFSPNGNGSSKGGEYIGEMNDEDIDLLSPDRKAATMDEQKAADATLAEYELYRVENNWLDDDLQQRMMSLEADREEDELSIDEQTDRLIEQLEALPDGYGDKRDLFVNTDDSGEPWDTYGMDASEVRKLVGNRFIPHPPPDSEFYLDLNEPADPEELSRIEAELWERLKDCELTSRRLERARRSEKAKAFFSRKPNESQGYDRLWVAALDNQVFRNIVGLLRDYGVEFADNFGDFESTRPEDLLYSIADIASMKARKVYEVTGLPCVASRTSFEIEPVPPTSPIPIKGKGGGPGSTSTSAPRSSNPRVLSGYRFNDIGMHVNYLCDAMRPVSEPTRVTRFTSCVCYYDGELEIFEHSECDVDLHFANTLRTFIPLSQCIHDMADVLKLTHGLEFQKFLQKHMEEAIGGSLGPGSIKLRDRVLKDAKVLPNKIIDVSKFMDSQVDVNLMDDCAKELAARFSDTRATKIVTIATTGLVIALPLAKYLQVPVVYARKERNVIMADTYKARYSSDTVGGGRELLISKSHLDPQDRILVVDDFLSSGAIQEALLTIISDAGATAVGVGVLLEKAYKKGRQSLSGFDIPIQSLCRVASVEEGVIQLYEEEGYQGM